MRLCRRRKRSRPRCRSNASVRAGASDRDRRGSRGKVSAPTREAAADIPWGCDRVDAQSADPRLFRHRSRDSLENRDRGTAAALAAVARFGWKRWRRTPDAIAATRGGRHHPEIPARQIRDRRRRRDDLHPRLGQDDARARHLGGQERDPRRRAQGRRHRRHAVLFGRRLRPRRRLSPAISASASISTWMWSAAARRPRRWSASPSA